MGDDGGLENLMPASAVEIPSGTTVSVTASGTPVVHEPGVFAVPPQD